jgi:hypothetical protein
VIRFVIIVAKRAFAAAGNDFWNRASAGHIADRDRRALMNYTVPAGLVVRANKLIE